MQRKEEALNMKKFLSVFLTAALAVSMLAGCGSKNETVTAKVIDIDPVSYTHLRAHET
mgnify:FL=1